MAAASDQASVNVSVDGLDLVAIRVCVTSIQISAHYLKLITTNTYSNMLSVMPKWRTVHSSWTLLMWN